MKQNKFDLLTFMKSQNFMLYIALFTVLYLMPNTYYVYCMFSAFDQPYRSIAGIGVSLIVASFVMIYTLRKNYSVARWYSYFEVSISAFYYVNTIYDNPKLSMWGLIPALGFTIILPISVYKSTQEIKDVEEPKKIIEPAPIITISKKIKKKRKIKSKLFDDLNNLPLDKMKDEDLKNLAETTKQKASNVIQWPEIKE